MTKNMTLSKHIIISNLIMLLIPFISMRFGLFSNQIHLIYQKQTNNYSSGSLLNLTNAQLSSIQQMPSLSRYLLSHCQFDGIHFITNQYDHQPNYAFIKGYVMVIQIVRNLIEKISQIFNLDQVFQGLSPFEIHIILLLLINKILFSISSIKLQKIAFYLTKDHKKSQLIATLFLYNPACIFFHSVYTESCYSFLTFSSILQLFKSQINKNYFISIGYLVVSVFFRTNGIFLAPIFGIPIIFQLWLNMSQKKWIKSLVSVFKGLVILSLIILPLLWYQYYTFSQLCNSSIDLERDGQLRIQCNKIWPNLYNFIQKKFWSVGFFSYWKMSNLIFIFIGLPAIFIGLSCFKDFLNSIKKIKSQNRMQLIKIGLQLSFAILYTITVILTNIQSSTRFFCSNAVFYMILERNYSNKLVKVWIFSYFTLGSILFCIGFPWT